MCEPLALALERILYRSRTLDEGEYLRKMGNNKSTKAEIHYAIVIMT
jgi:hypothetical protein